LQRYKNAVCKQQKSKENAVYKQQIVEIYAVCTVFVIKTCLYKQMNILK